MEVVDEKGRLFGVINVIDLLVAVVVVATLAAGAAFVLLDEPEPPRDRYATVVLEEGPTGVTPELGGNGASLSGLDVTITDTYRAPAADHRVTTVVRVRASLSAENANRSTARRLVTEERTIAIGEEVQLSTDDIGYVGYVRSFETTGTDLPVQTTKATVVTRLPPEVADRIERGDTQRIGDQRVARIIGIQRERTADNRTRVTATVELQVLKVNGHYLYGDRFVRPGANLTFATEDYEFTGTVTDTQ